MRNALLVIHIISVAAWLGGNLTLAFAGSMTRNADVAARRWWAVTQGAMARTYFNVAGILVVLTGVGLVLDGPFEFSNLFVTIGFIAVIIGALLGIIVFGPGCRQLVEAIDSGDAALETSLMNRMATAGAIDSAVIVIALVGMVARWGFP